MAMISRSDWGARSPRGSYTTLTRTKGTKVHFVGNRVDPRLVDDHDRCLALMRQIQSWHMDGNGWSDFAYNLAVCPHGDLLMGRGPGHMSAANGEGLNRDHYAVLGMLGSTGLTDPTDAMLGGILDAIQLLRDKGGAGKEIKGHRDGYSTDCPGGPLYAWVRAGAPRPSTTAPPIPSPAEEEQMPEIVSLGLSAEVTVPPNVAYQPWWSEEWKDTTAWHPANGQSIVPDADVWADLAAHVALRGLAPGELVELGLTRHLADGNLVDIAWPQGRLMTVRADADGRVEVGLNGHFKLGSAHRGRVTIRHTSAGTVRLETASVFKGILHRYA